MRTAPGIAGVKARAEDRSATRIPRARALSARDERALMSRAKAGDRRARQDLAERSIGLVQKIAREFSSQFLARTDLIQEGMVGLLQAIDRFDLDRELRFSTYAVWWIRRSMHEAVTNGRAIRIPAQAARHLAAIRSAESNLQAVGRRRPTDAQIARATGLRTSTVRKLRAAPFVACSFDEPSGADGLSLADHVANTVLPDNDDAPAAGEAAGELSGLLALLPNRHREVLTCHYGLGRDGPMSHRDVGLRVGVGEARSRQLEQEALRRLRSMFRGTRTRGTPRCRPA